MDRQIDPNTTGRFLQFLEAVAANPELEDRVAAIEPWDTASLVKLAAAYGFVFTPEEFQTAVREVSAGNKELSAAELDSVSDGKLPGKKKPPTLTIHRAKSFNSEQAET